MIISANKKQTSDCCSISLNPYNYGISNLELWRKKKRKRKAILLLAYIADVSSCLTNRSFYMRTLSLSKTFYTTATETVWAARRLEAFFLIGRANIMLA